MTKPVITCFSSDSENVNALISQLHNYYGLAIDQTIFQEKSVLLESLKSNIFLCKQTQLFVIDTEKEDKDSVEFIKEINQNCLASTKLIIAENSQLEHIRKSVKNNGSLLFLSRPWKTEDFKHALNIASETFDNCCLKEISSLNEVKPDKKIEDAINPSLQKLIDANSAKDNFLSIISHDLKSPFSALQGLSEILLNDWKQLSEQTKIELISDLHKTSVDTHKLLETLLEWTKLNKNKLELSVNEIAVSNLVDSTLKVSKNNASVKGIEIQNKIGNDVLIKTDKNILATIFRNLISNAVQYIQPGGQITISGKAENKGYTFCVADNGPGIDKTHILDYFSRNNGKSINGNANEFKGLGLVICKDFVEKSGGKIWLESSEQGQGTSFYFTLPNAVNLSTKGART